MAVRDKPPFEPGYIYFVTFTILDWIKIFIDDRYFNLVYKWFDYVKENYQNQIYGYVIMPNHIHALIYISDKSPAISKLIQNAKRFLAYDIVDLLKQDNRQNILEKFKEKVNKKKGAKHKVFENGYDSKIITSTKFFDEKLNYIHNNPCHEKWRLAKVPEEYKYSSASNYLLGQGVYDVEIMIA